MNNTEIILIDSDIKRSPSQGVFSDFSLPNLIFPIRESKKKCLFEKLLSFPAIAKVIKGMNAKDYIVEIPEHLLDEYKRGNVNFGKSRQSKGNLSCNIYNKKGELVGQANIKEISDFSKLTESLTDLSMMLMLQSISEQISELSEKVGFILKGQKNDRLGSIIGSFKAYVIARNTFGSEAERRQAAYIAYSTMNEGICQMHFQLNESRERLNTFPKSTWDQIKKETPHFYNLTDYEGEYRMFVKDLYDLYNMIILSDVLLIELNASKKVLLDNHKSFNAFLERTINNDLYDVAKYIIDSQPKEIADFMKKSKEAFRVFDKNLETNKMNKISINKLSYESR